MPTTVGMSDPRPQTLQATPQSVQGYRPIQWIDPSDVSVNAWSPYAAQIAQWEAAGRPAAGSEAWQAIVNSAPENTRTVLSDVLGGNSDVQAAESGTFRGYGPEQLQQLAAQGINTNFTGAGGGDASQAVRYLTGAEAAARGLDPNGQFMLIHQTDPRDGGSGNRTQAYVAYQRGPDGQAIPVWSSDGFQGEDPSASNRRAAMMVGGALAFGLGGAAMGAGSAAEGGAAASAGAGTGAASNATNAALIESAVGTSGYGASSAGLGGASMAGAGGATNAALIESAVGTPGYGASSVGAGGVNTAATNAALIESALNTPGYGASSAGAGANSTGTIGGSSWMNTAREVYDNANRVRQVANAVNGQQGGATSSGGGSGYSGMSGMGGAAMLADRTEFKQPDLESVYGLSTKAAKKPASGVKADPSDPVDANGLQIAAIQELTQRVQQAKAKLARLQGAAT